MNDGSRAGTHQDSGSGNPLNAHVDSVPAVGGPAALTLVHGHAFIVSALNGDLSSGIHGYVDADRRYLSLFAIAVDGQPLAPAVSATPSPGEMLVVHRLRDREGYELPGVVVRRRSMHSSGFREHIELRATTSKPVAARISLHLGSDFAHLFEVKERVRRPLVAATTTTSGAELCDTNGDLATGVRWDRPATVAAEGNLLWDLGVEARQSASIVVTVEIGHDTTNGDLVLEEQLAPPIESVGQGASTSWVACNDPRLSLAVEQALVDLRALQLRDSAHPDRLLIAAGAPWFMTLFGRDSLLTTWMALPFDTSFVRGVLLTLADLQGRRFDALAEEEPGKILHEVRHGGSGPFRDRERYYGSIDATPIFVMVVAEAWRWGALDDQTLEQLAPAVRAAVAWLAARGVPDGFLAYSRQTPSGLVNQGWKDSWDGINFADGTIPEPPIALVEVQGYVYAALRAAATLAAVLPGAGLDADDLNRRAEILRQRFNEEFWLDDGWFAVGLDGQGRRIDALTSNPGHALWCRIADADLADRYLDRLLDSEMLSGFGVRTLATTMAAADPMSYHNGSVWPHDTAICAAGAAAYGRWDVVDAIVEAALDATASFDGRPPELFAGFDRGDLPVPVPYPASCSPQAWASASTLLLLRTMLGVDVTGEGPVVTRPDLRGLEDMSVYGMRTGRERHDLTIIGTEPRWSRRQAAV